MDYAKRLAPGGLIFSNLVSEDQPLIPPNLATLTPGYPPANGGWPRSVVNRTEPKFIATANEAWFDLSRSGGLFGDDREFLVAVEVQADEEVWWWARVKLAESWDLVGAGAAASLGTGFGMPEFLALSLSGDTIVFCTSDESAVGTALVTEFRNLSGIRELATWKADWPQTQEAERSMTRRWLDAG